MVLQAEHHGVQAGVLLLVLESPVAARTGIFLELNGWAISAPGAEVAAFVQRVIVERLSVAEVADWLRHNSDAVISGLE